MAPTQQQVFARRRSLAILVLIVLALASWGFLSSASNQQAEPTPIPISDSVTNSAVSTDLENCQAGVVTVAAKVGDANGTRNSFASDEKPMIWYEITNTGSVDCLFNVGARVTFFTISSGGETYWSSKDCPREGLEDLSTVLKANLTIPSDRNGAIWERVRSGTEGCGAGLQAVPAGGASYFLKVEVNGVYSEESVQFLLN